jgi:hypothetical protein
LVHIVALLVKFGSGVTRFSTVAIVFTEATAGQRKSLKCPS